MNDSCAIRSRAGREISTTPHQRIHQGAGPVSRRWMHHHPGWLVHDEQVFVLEHNGERNRLAGDLPNCCRRLVDHDPVAGNRPVARFLSRSVHDDVSVRDERRRLGSRKLRGRCNKQIEANVSVRLDDDLVPLAGAQIS